MNTETFNTAQKLQQQIAEVEGRILTKSLLSQLPQASLDAMRDGLVLGYVNLPKMAKTALIKHEGKTYTRALQDWDKSGETTLAASTRRRVFWDTESRDEWLAAYKKMKAKALETQIFI